MSTTYTICVGDRGRLVIPSSLRTAGGLVPGTELTLIDTGSGLVLLTREQLLMRIRHDLADTGDLVGELLEERRAEVLAQSDDANHAA